ncbi:intradiol ring-cleavage dioxygenase [Brachybacterium sp. DNPG3]
MTDRDPRLEQAPDGTLSYQGRTLAHQDEPLADQGLGFDLATMVGRRRALALLGAGAAATGLAACSTSDGSTSAEDSAASDGGTSTTTADGEIPEETNGPYPADGTNGVTVLTESGIVRADITSSFGDSTTTVPGVPMTLTLSITNLNEDNAPYEGIAVYIWHCTGDGLYSLYSEGLEEENFLRGVQVADADGKVTFTSIWPGCYSGRWPHIHFEVYPDVDSITSTDNLLATSQVALPQDVCEEIYALEDYDGSTENLANITLDSDNVFGDDGGELQLGTAEGDTADGYMVTLDVAIDPTTEPGVTDSAPSGGGGGGMGGSDAGSGPSDGGGMGEPPSGGMGGASDGGGAEPSSWSDGEGSLVGNQLVSSR